MNKVVEKWDEILQIVKTEHDLSDVSFNTWLKPLTVYEVVDNVVTIIVPSEQVGLNYISKKYKLPLQVTISEVTGMENCDINFILPEDVPKKEEVSPKAQSQDARMNSGAMFGNLDLYADETYYQEHPFAYLQTEDSIQEYRIVTVLKADRNLFPFQQKLADAEAVQEYLKAAKQREVFETGDDYLKCIYDKVLTLVTCSYEWSGARNIVLAVPVSGAVWSQKCS